MERSIALLPAPWPGSCQQDVADGKCVPLQAWTLFFNGTQDFTIQEGGILLQDLIYALSSLHSPHSTRPVCCMKHWNSFSISVSFPRGNHNGEYGHPCIHHGSSIVGQIRCRGSTVKIDAVLLINNSNTTKHMQLTGLLESHINPVTVG